jgi:6-pyruvoyltetrahydropterin/6-carboxytetrahydropterin synthase
MISCSKTIEFDAAHRIIGHTGGCQMVHGHRYAVELTFSSTSLDEIGMVIDFKEIKTRFKTWIDTNWDHNMILNRADKELGDMIAKYTGQKVFYLDCNPTSENIASYLFNVVLHEVFSDARHYIQLCRRITISESPTSWASCEK